MIRDSRISYRKRDAFPFLLWSCLIIAASLLSYVVIETGYGEYAEWPWIILMIGGGILTFIYIGFKNRSDGKNMNFAQKCASTLWLSFFISMFLLYLMAYYIRPFNFPALIYMITGLCTFTSGSIYRFKPFYAGGIVFWSVPGLCPLQSRPLGIALEYSGYVLRIYDTGYYAHKKSEKLCLNLSTLSCIRNCD